MLDFNLFGQRLRMLRKQTGENQSELAKHLGVSVSQISDMEKGRKGTNLERFTMICEYYGVSADYLLGLSDDPNPRPPQGHKAPLAKELSAAEPLTEDCLAELTSTETCR